MERLQETLHTDGLATGYVHYNPRDDSLQEFSVFCLNGRRVRIHQDGRIVTTTAPTTYDEGFVTQLMYLVALVKTHRQAERKAQ